MLSDLNSSHINTKHIFVISQYSSKLLEKAGNPKEQGREQALFYIKTPMPFLLSLSSPRQCTRIPSGIIAGYSLLWQLSRIIKHTVSLPSLNALHKHYFQSYSVCKDPEAPGISQPVSKKCAEKQHVP